MESNHSFHKLSKRAFPVQGNYSCEYTACWGSLSWPSPACLSPPTCRLSSCYFAISPVPEPRMQVLKRRISWLLRPSRTLYNQNNFNVIGIKDCWTILKRNWFTHVHSSINHNSQKVEATQVPTNGWNHKQSVVPYTGILVSNKKGESSVTCFNI